MPFKSKAQRRKFAELLVKGKITDEAYERWNKETGGAELPEYVDPKKSKRKSKAKSKVASRSKSTTRTARKSPGTRSARSSSRSRS